MRIMILCFRVVLFVVWRLGRTNGTDEQNWKSAPTMKSLSAYAKMLGCTNVSIRHNECTVRDTAATRQHTNQPVDVRLTLSNRRCRCGEGEHDPSALNYPGPMAIYLSIHISISLVVSSGYIFSVVGINDRLLGD